ncbi:MAG: Ig-like domain-containing protein [Lachnospiraceae bacterium]|nr:Ig-like domain-containing protein [Lachnospiraceae bacterium]
MRLSIYKRTLITLSFVVFLSLAFITNAKAATVDFNPNNQDYVPATINVGDTGTIKPNLSFIQDSQSLESCTYSFSSSDYSILTVDNNGVYQALNTGSASVTINVYSGYDYWSSYPNIIFSATIQFTIGIDMTNVTLSTDNIHTYMMPEYYYMSKTYYNRSNAVITLNSEIPISNNGDNVFSYTCSNPMLNLSAELYNNTITISQNSYTEGNTYITFNIYGKEFVVFYQSTKVDISNQSCLLVKGKKIKLNVTGYTDPIIWTSSNPSIATVDSNGVVKGKKIGNVIIKAQIGEHYLGCAVSVTKSKIKKVTERATYIGTHWKYSQAKRTQKGYYDCSALVWKAYKEKAGVTFGSPWYPGVALTEAKWCRAHGKMISGGMTYKKVMKMTVNPGDLLFKSSDMKKKYKDIYHVEMFTGYFCHYVSDDGTAAFSPMWAARGTYYSWENGSLLGRPMK